MLSPEEYKKWHEEQQLKIRCCVATPQRRKSFNEIIKTSNDKVLIDIVKAAMVAPFKKTKKIRKFNTKKHFKPRYIPPVFVEKFKSLTPKEKYAEYLRSDLWDKKRKEFLNYFKKKNGSLFCENCHSSFRLNVHHKTYDNLYHERMKDLMLLCKWCHSEKHNKPYFIKN
jgi:hypothetical protein